MTWPGTGLFVDYDYHVTGEVTRIRENGAASGIGVLAVLLGVSPGTKGDAAMISSTTVRYDSYDTAGPDALSYTVRDSLGASSTGTLNVTITSGGTCQ